MKIKFLLVGAFVLLLSSCQKEENLRPLSTIEKKGKSIYYANCIACHNPDPRLDGSTGPAISESSFELIEKRVLSRTYPEGYKPKRTSEIMPEFEGLKDDIDELHAYLNSFNQK